MFEKQCKIRVMVNKKGFTLVELLIVMSILIVLAVSMLGAFNPSGMFNRGRDALRKKDLNRIKVAFEEYMNDNQHYPDSTVVSKLMDKNNCGKNIPEFPDLQPWPCDPDGNPYNLVVYPNSFKVLTNLENKSDKDILAGWYELESFVNVGGYTNNNVNYGVSSTNTLWYDSDILSECMFFIEDHTKDVCNKSLGPNNCQAAESAKDCFPGSGINCYASIGCNEKCMVPCCGFGCD